MREISTASVGGKKRIYERDIVLLPSHFAKEESGKKRIRRAAERLSGAPVQRWRVLLASEACHNFGHTHFLTRKLHNGA